MTPALLAITIMVFGDGHAEPLPRIDAIALLDSSDSAIRQAAAQALGNALPGESDHSSVTSEPE